MHSADPAIHIETIAAPGPYTSGVCPQGQFSPLGSLRPRSGSSSSARTGGGCPCGGWHARRCCRWPWRPPGLALLPLLLHPRGQAELLQTRSGDSAGWLNRALPEPSGYPQNHGVPPALGLVGWVGECRGGGGDRCSAIEWIFWGVGYCWQCPCFVKPVSQHAMPGRRTMGMGQVQGAQGPDTSHAGSHEYDSRE